jgi:uncharacterized phage protein (TIGR02216 family)
VSGPFAAGAAKLAGLIPRAFGWRPDDFWNATPAELAAIVGASSAPNAEPLSRTELDRMLERERHG